MLVTLEFDLILIRMAFMAVGRRVMIVERFFAVVVVRVRSFEK